MIKKSIRDKIINKKFNNVLLENHADEKKILIKIIAIVLVGIFGFYFNSIPRVNYLSLQNFKLLKSVFI